MTKPATPVVVRRRSLPLVWVVPLVAFIVGGWMIVRNSRDHGPEITIHFQNGAGIEALAREGLLGLLSSPEVGGMGLGPGSAALVVERIARDCASTAMILTMHYAGTAVLEKHAPVSVRGDTAAGRHLSTLAFSESGSRSHFWAPMGTARSAGGRIRLDAKNSWVTTAGNATA